MAAAAVMCLILGLGSAIALSPTQCHAETAQTLATGAMANFSIADEPLPAPDGEFTDADGNPVRLSDFRGKLVLLNFWATWCGPCVRELPDLDRLQAELGSAAFQVVALSSDRKGPEVIGPFFAKHEVRNLAIYNDRRGGVQRAFKVLGLPTTVLLDAEGRELGRLVGPAEWGGEDARRLIRHFIAADGKPEG